MAGNKKEVQPFKVFVDAANKILGQAIGWLMGFTPDAVLSLIARAVGSAGLQSKIVKMLKDIDIFSRCMV